MPVTYLHILNGEIVGRSNPTRSRRLTSPFDGKYCHELIRKDRMETTLKTALSLATTAEVYGKVGLVDKRALPRPL